MNSSVRHLLGPVFPSLRTIRCRLPIVTQFPSFSVSMSRSVHQHASRIAKTPARPIRRTDEGWQSTAKTEHPVHRSSRGRPTRKSVPTTSGWIWLPVLGINCYVFNLIYQAHKESGETKTSRNEAIEKAFRVKVKAFANEMGLCWAKLRDTVSFVCPECNGDYHGHSIYCSKY
jgi:hypothetical protein